MQAPVAAKAVSVSEIGPDWSALMDPSAPESALIFLHSTPERVARRAAGLVHLSAPCLGPAGEDGAWRMERAVRASMLAAVEVARLAALGCTAIAPAITLAEIAHAGRLMDQPLDPLHLGFWEAWSQPILNVAAAVVVPDIAGWSTCPLVWREVRFALTHNIPVHVYARQVERV